jgi:hypothetical protein
MTMTLEHTKQTVIPERVGEHGRLGSNRLAALAAEIRAAHSAATAAAPDGDRQREASR